MRIVTHLSGFLDWVDVPDDVEVTLADIQSGKVMPAPNWTAARPKWRAKVERKMDTINTSGIAEEDIIQAIIGAYTEKGKCRRIMTRHEAVEQFMRGRCGDNFAQTHMKHVEVYDDGPDEDLFRKILATHLEADHGKAEGKNVDAEDVDALVAAYVTPPPGSDAEHPHALGARVYPEGHHDASLVGAPHPGIGHARGNRAHLMRAFRLKEKSQ